MEYSKELEIKAKQYYQEYNVLDKQANDLWLIGKKDEANRLHEEAIILRRKANDYSDKLRIIRKSQEIEL